MRVSAAATSTPTRAGAIIPGTHGLCTRHQRTADPRRLVERARRRRSVAHARRWRSGGGIVSSLDAVEDRMPATRLRQSGSKSKSRAQLAIT
jgi:hypothetical protein